MQFGSRPAAFASLYMGSVVENCSINDSIRVSPEGCVDMNSGILVSLLEFMFFHNTTLSRGSKPAFAMYWSPMTSASDSCMRLNGLERPSVLAVDNAL